MRRRLFLFAIVLMLGSIAPMTAVYAETGSATVQLEVEKQVDGEAPSSPEEYVFVLEGDGDAPMPSENRTVVVGEGKADFPEITYTEPETYQYTIREVPGSSARCTYDSSVYDVTVMVTTDEEGDLTANVSATREGENVKADEIRFVNKYEPTPSDEEDGSSLSQTGDRNYIAIAAIICVAVIVIAAGAIIRRKGAGK